MGEYPTAKVKRNKNVNPDRQKTLKELGFGWVLFKRGASVPWDDMYALF